ncbi:MAG: ATP-binding cassette domain-containing protein [Lachnospiraceae bacterium]|nr:ATP-binding cassette domain-containing protein [Lachnospiraceae bacterium]
MRNIRQNKGFKIGAVILALMVFCALLSLIWTPYGVNSVSSDTRLLGPRLFHFFGTDNLGRDVLSRVMVGIRTTILAAVGIVGIGAFFGTIIGALTGYFGGVVDEVIMRLNDGLASFPSILLAMVCVAVFGTGTLNVILVLGVLFIPSFARVMRSEYLMEKEKDYVKNIKLHGASAFRIMFKHILPNTKQSLFSAIAIGINNAILAESGLSYLGLGVQPPTPSLGRMMSEGQTYIFKAGWICVFPGICIILIVLGTALISENIGNSVRSEFTVFESRKLRAYLADRRSEAGLEAGQPEEVCENTEKSENSGMPKTDKTPVLVIRKLRTAVDVEEPEEVVKGVDFTVYEGEALGIVGESGSGKSMSSLSIMNLLSGRGEFIADSIVFNGREIVKNGEKLLDEKEYDKFRGSEIAMVFQEPMTALDPAKKTAEFLKEIYLNRVGKEHKADAEEKIREVFAEAGIRKIDEVMRSYPHELSGGQRQRVLIAAALIGEPKLIILDEPTTAIDAQIAEKIMGVLSKLHKEKNISLIFISHDIELTKRLCSRIAVMKNGRVVEIGEGEQILMNPRNEYTKELIAACSEKKYRNVWDGYEENPEELEKQENIIEARKLNVSYKNHGGAGNKVIKDFNLTVKKGEVVGISGKSGCGKSTLLKTISGLLHYTGELKVNGRLSMVFQDPYSSLNPSMRIGQMLMEVLKLNAKRKPDSIILKEELRKKAVEALADAELSEEYFDRYPSELSGGQRQRAAIAIALAVRPDIVLLDEPVTALDVTIQDKILTLLAKLQAEQNLTYLLISHDAGLLESFCDRVVKM